MATYLVEVEQTVGSRLPQAWWLQLFTKTARHLKHRQASRVSVGVVGEAAMRSVHQRYAGSKKVTDVLSFAERDSIVASRQEKGYLGEVIICYPQAVRQAKQYGHSVKDEMALLFVHGLLHLVGFDHDTKAKATKMRSSEAAILGTEISRTAGR